MTKICTLKDHFKDVSSALAPIFDVEETHLVGDREQLGVAFNAAIAECEALLYALKSSKEKFLREPRYRYKLVYSDFLGKFQDVCLKIYRPHTHILVSALMLDLFRTDADSTLIETAQRVVNDIEVNDNLDKYDEHQDSLIP